MKTSTFRRFMPLIALMLCATTLIVHARGAPLDTAAVPAAAAPAPVAPAPPLPASEAPTSAASPPADGSATADWEGDDGRNEHHPRHGRHIWRDHHGNDLVSIG